MCTDCADQSCSACELRLRDARTCDELTRQLAWAAQAAHTARRQPEPDPPPEPTADKEAGQ